MTFLAGKKILITGVASKKSIAYGIAKAMYAQGAELAFTYQNERFKPRVEAVAEEFGSSARMCFACDVTNDAEIETVFTDLGKHWDGLDGLVHAIAYAPSDELGGKFADVSTREGFRMAHDISSYSLVALTKHAQHMMKDRGNVGIITLTYHASQQTVPSYNVMGLAKASLEAGVRYLAASLGNQNIRVNAISAGPIKTLAAAGIKNFRKMLSHNEKQAPLKRTVTTEEVGNVAAFLCSPLASGITGEIIYVDAGYRTTTMAEFEE